MTRLVNAQRRLLVDHLIKAIRLPKDVSFRTTSGALAVRAIILRYGETVFAQCREKPDGWFKVAKRCTLSHNLRQHLPPVVLSNGAHVEWIELSEYAPLPFSMNNEFTRAEICGALFDAIHALFTDMVAFNEQMALLVRQTNAVVNSFYTVEKLAEEWPEGYAHFPHETLGAGAPVENLPALRIADLNARIEAVRAA